MINPKLQLGLTFGILTKMYVGSLNKKLESLDIERYFFVLVMISERKSKCTQQSIADALQIDKVGVVKIIDYLSKKGYVVRENNPEDRREVHINLTPKAKKVLPKMYDAFGKTNDEATAGFTKKQKEDFFEQLTMATLNLSRSPSKGVTIEIKPRKK